MLSAHDIQQSIRSLQFTIEEKQNTGQDCQEVQDKLSHLQELLRAVEQGLVRK